MMIKDQEEPGSNSTTLPETDSASTGKETNASLDIAQQMKRASTCSSEIPLERDTKSYEYMKEEEKRKYLRRQKNVLAVTRCRERKRARKTKENEKKAFLDHENATLREKVKEMRTLVQLLKQSVENQPISYYSPPIFHPACHIQQACVFTDKQPVLM